MLLLSCLFWPSLLLTFLLFPVYCHWLSFRHKLSVFADFYSFSLVNIEGHAILFANSPLHNHRVIYVLQIIYMIITPSIELYAFPNIYWPIHRFFKNYLGVNCKDKPISNGFVNTNTARGILFFYSYFWSLTPIFFEVIQKTASSTSIDLSISMRTNTLLKYMKSFIFSKSTWTVNTASFMPSSL